jgi:hypothetical protein
MSVREKCDEKSREERRGSWLWNSALRKSAREVPSTQAPAPGIGAHPCKERKDGAPSVVVAQANIVQRVGRPPRTADWP